MAVKSKIAGSMLADLMDAPPLIRNAWLLELDPADFLAVTGAAADLLGTPFGLWQDDFRGFVEIGLGESLWPKQDEIGRSLVENERTAVPYFPDAGKSHLAARAVAWFVCVWPAGTAKAITTASRWRQVKFQLWPHIRAIHARAKLPGICLQTEWQMGPLKYPAAYGLSPDDYDETAFSGIHDPHVLAVVDEAGGLSPTLGQSLESLMSGEHARLLLIGNPPIDETGSPWFEERCSKPTYNVIRLPASATPNFTGQATPLCRVHPDMEPHPISQHLVSKRWVESIRSDYGEDDPYYIARVEAEFPKDVTGKAIPRTWLEAAAGLDRGAGEPPPTPAKSRWVRLGVDVAADGGDELAIARADGYVLRVVKTSRGAANAEPHDVAGMILEQIEEAEVVRRELGSKRPVRVKIDAIGVGWGIAGILKAWRTEGRHRAEIVPVSVGKACRTTEGSEKFANQRAEMWWNGRLLSTARRNEAGEKIDPTWRLDVTDAEVKQLAGPKYGRTSDGRIKIETKDDMKKRGIQSPDRGEAILLAVYEPSGSGRGRVASTDARLPEPPAG